MWADNILFNKKPNYEKLLEFGFQEVDGCYQYCADIVDGTLFLNVSVFQDGTTRLKVIDKLTNEEYNLINICEFGSFVGQVRSACEDVLLRIVENCFAVSVFKCDLTSHVIEYAKTKYGTQAEYLWAKFPSYAVLRESKSRKWYAVLMSISKKTLGINEDGTVEVINLKETTKNIEKLIDGEKYFSGFHMNKKHWYTLRLDGKESLEEVFSRVDASFNLVANAKRK